MINKIVRPMIFGPPPGPVSAAVNEDLTPLIGLELTDDLFDIQDLVFRCHEDGIRRLHHNMPIKPHHGQQAVRSV